MLEGQNDDQLDGLHQKLKALHAVTRDIHDDSRGQNTMLDGTVRGPGRGTAEGAGAIVRLVSRDAVDDRRSLRSHHRRQSEPGVSHPHARLSSQSRTILYFIGGAVVLFLLIKLFK